MINESLMEIIIDSREHKEKICEHILSYLNMKKIKYTFEKLDFGDYSFKYKKESFANRFSIERKNSLNELAGNFAKGRERFENEFKRAKNAKMILMIENGSISGVLNNNYDTELKVKSYYATLLSWRFKYNLDIDFVHDGHAGLHIYWNCYYFLRDYLRKIGDMND